MTRWTMNTWGAAHQNAAVFMRNLGPLARAPRRVMRRKRRAVVIHTVSGATAKDGVLQCLDRAPPPLPSLLTHLSLLQGQCSTKFLSPPPLLCLSGPECIHVATWGLKPLFDHSPAPPPPLPDRGTKERRVDRDPGILICCYFRTQASGFPHPSFFSPQYSSSSLQGSRHFGPSLVLLFSLPNCLSWDPVILAPLHSVLESPTLRLGFQQPQLSLPRSQSDSR